MSKNVNEAPYVNLDDAAKYIAEQTGCSIDQAELFFYGETEYLRTLDLIIDEDELPEEGPPAEESPQNTNTVIEIEELRDYVSNYTGLERGLVERIDDCWYDYMKQHDLIVEY
ncbi:MAG: hypothetical protein E7300_09300 [Lachnospiraceae bacterium]|nr:hypothetical protein [Lachnospiraceae bacterium]